VSPSTTASERRSFSKPRTATALTLTAILFFVLVAIGAIWLLPPRIIEDGISNPEVRTRLLNDSRTTVAQTVAGIALLLGLFFTARNVAASEHNAAAAQANVAVAQENLAVVQSNLAVLQRGQIAERFTRAIEQLGATNEKGTMRIEVRLGGIYALETIAADDPERFHNTVLDVLTSYIRGNTAHYRSPKTSSDD
jgi:hypothetical protein